MNIEDGNWGQWVLGILMAVLAWLGKIIHTKANNAVSRVELKEAMDEWQDERRSMHAENKETLARIHARIDEVYRHMNFRRD
jgi:hypothetical protein